MSKDSVNAIQVGGGHYKSRYQHWDFVLQVLAARYLEGNITKYMTRWQKKNGLEDLKKASHYLDKLITLAKAGDMAPLHGARKFNPMPNLNLFLAENKLTGRDARIITLVSDWTAVADLVAARGVLSELIQEEQAKYDEVAQLIQENP